MKAVAATYGATVVPTVTCDPAGDTDHYPFWVAGIPGYVIEEWGSESNPHYDQTGNDTLDKINLANRQPEPDRKDPDHLPGPADGHRSLTRE